jgi:hypothetical protein
MYEEKVRKLKQPLEMVRQCYDVVLGERKKAIQV